MAASDWLAGQFEEKRTHLRAVAYRMLGSVNEADDAVQEAWLRLSRSDATSIENLGGWLTTAVARVSLDMLRARDARREDLLGVHLPDPIVSRADALDPEQEAILAVVADARTGMFWDESGGAYLYFPATSADLATLDMSLLVRATGAANIGRGIGDIARQLDPDAPLTTTPLTDAYALQLLPYQYAALIASGVGFLGISLAVLGLYGVVAFAVAQRRREIAIHVAMGAAPRDVLALVLRGEMRLVLRGLVVGFALALGEAKLLGSIVIPLSPIGLASLGVLALGLVVVALVATVAPGLSALRIAPMQVLRQE